MTMRRYRWSLLLGLVVAACCAAAPADDEDRARRWRADLDQLFDNIETLHVDPFHALAEEQWRREIEALKERVPDLSEAGMLFETQRLVALLGEGHTQLLWQRGSVPLTMYPLRLQWFADGLFVVGASADGPPIMRAQLLGIGEHQVAELYNQIRPYLSVDNEVQAQRQFTQYVLYAELLEHLGVVAVDWDPTSGKPKPPLTARFRFKLPDGQLADFDLEPMSSLDAVNWLSPLADEQKPLYLKYPQSNYFALYLPGVPPARAEPPAEPESDPTRDSPDDQPAAPPPPNVLFFQYNRCEQRGDLPFADFLTQLWALCERVPIERFVIDLRHNGGGDSSILGDFIAQFAANEKLNVPNRVFCAIGPRTFSSAVLNALELHARTHAILVGEPSGGRPNHYGEVKSFELKHSRLTVTYSTKHFRMISGDPETIRPELAVPLTSADYFAGRDPVLEAIQAFDPEHPPKLDLGQFGAGEITLLRPGFGD